MYRVLIVDDEPMICLGLQMMVEWKAWGFSHVDTASCGEEALACMEKNLPDLLITDIRMPRMDGIELVKEVRRREWEVHILVLSGYDDFEYVRSMAAQGIENYLLKPVNEEELNSNVTNVVHKIQKEGERKQRAKLDRNLIEENIINRWLYGVIGEKELQERAEFLDLNLEAEQYQPFLLKRLGKDAAKDGEMCSRIHEICTNILKGMGICYCSRNHNGETIAVWCDGDRALKSVLIECICAVERQLGEKIYAMIGNTVETYWNVHESFRDAVKNGLFRGDETELSFASGNDLEKNLSPFTIRMAQYALEHYAEDLSLKTLALQFKGNAAYLGQSFKKDTGRSFSDYLKEIRIRKAKEMLAGDKHTAKEIGIRVGFSSDAYFSATFKEETGLTPAEYRKEIRK